MNRDDQLTHLDREGQARMVDVGEKDKTAREAKARATVRMKPETRRVLLSGEVPKGDALAVARIAGIQAAKRTSELIPLCHPLAITSCDVEFRPADDDERFVIEASVRCADRTGVEMEALTAVSVAALTLYDMLKAIDRALVIEEVVLLEKQGGRTGHYRRGR
ncbi:MAG: cyclic pyranopterin monophosphate synthase MoaC [Myxococcales bacterium]|jgi:cyclic pyranopterin phosphate synthase|nr:cyclic pyranopterin monophosphate synthase MoaC [Myxococcales bacterium]